MEGRQPFPPWLRELCYFGGLIVVLCSFLLTMKSDQQADSKTLLQVQADVAAIRTMLPNKEADALRYKILEDKVDKNQSDLSFAIAKLEKWKDDTTRYLIKKGVIE